MSKSNGIVPTTTENPEIDAAQGELDDAQLDTVAGGASLKTHIGRVWAWMGGGGGSDSGGGSGGGGIRG